MAGAPVVAFAFLDFVVHRGRRPTLGRRGIAAYDQESDIYTLSCVCALGSVLAMPLGLLMMPHLATERTFGA